MKEPSVLDFLKSRLNPWQKDKIQIPFAAESAVSAENDEAEFSGSESIVQDETAPNASFLNTHDEDGMREITIKLRLPVHIPWRTLLALLMALIGQRTLEPPADAIPIGVGFYFFALLDRKSTRLNSSH